MSDLIIIILDDSYNIRTAIKKNASDDLIALALKYNNQDVDDDDFLDIIETEMTTTNLPIQLNLSNTVITTIGIY